MSPNTSRGVPQQRAADRLSDDEARSLIDRFTKVWAHPRPEDFVAVLHPDCRMLQPAAPPLHGRDAVRDFFDRLLRWLPDARGTVDHAGHDGEEILIAWRLAMTVGGKPYELRIADRIVPEDGLIREREAYYDSMAFLLMLLRRPSAWLGYWRFRGLLPGKRGSAKRTRRNS